MILDPIQSGEARAESAYYRMVQPDGRLKCDCGKVFDPDDEGGTVTADPYAMPVCGECLEKAFPELSSESSFKD